MPKLEAKQVQLIVKADDEPGTVSAVFSTFNEIDKDGDITRPGAFGTQSVLLGAYGHASTGHFGVPVPPVGRGEIHEESNRAVFTGKFNLEMFAAKELYESIKMSGSLQQWSYGFRIDKESFEEQDGRMIRVIEKASVFEVSPVMQGAGRNTRTLGVKGYDSLPMEEHTDEVLATWSSYIARVKSLADLRAKEGRKLSQTNQERLEDLRTKLQELDGELAQLLKTEPPADSSQTEEAHEAFLAYLKTKSRILGTI